MMLIIILATAIGLCVAIRGFARVTYSPLITSASGSVGDTVFSKWKGRAYIRARVTPANPQTSAQTSVRDSMARCVQMWQSFETQLKAAWNLYAGPFSISGYNAFVKLNRLNEQTDTTIETSPINNDVQGVVDMALASGSSSGEIDVTWTDPGQGASHKAYILTRKELTNVWVIQSKDTVLMSAEAYTITGLVGGDDYYVTLASEETVDSLFSLSDWDLGTALA